MNFNTLQHLPFVERFYSYPLLASTSDTARSMTEFPTSGIVVVQADRQSQGRGRRGAVFFSDNSGGLWVSIVTPVSSIDEHFIHNRALSLALCNAIETVCGIKNALSIKWPNDIYWHDKKLCGILLENHPGNPHMLVLGFGCNIAINKDEFPVELHSIATSLLIETGKRHSRSTILKNVIERYHENRSADQAVLHQAYLERLYGINKTIEVDGHCGIFDGVEIDGRLRLKHGQELIYITTGHLRFTSNGENNFDRQKT